MLDLTPYRRQAMSSSTAWQRHGCYKMGSDQYFNMPLEKALLGCQDDWNSLDHFDPTTPTRRMMAQFNYLRSVYPAIQDGLNLVQRGNWTHFVQLPGSNQTQTEIGWWSASRAAIPQIQNFQGNHTDQVWLIYTNENSTIDYQFDCMGPLWISAPYQSGTTVRNLFAPYETYQLQDSKSSFNNNSQAPWTGCLPKLTLEPYSFKALVPQQSWVPPLPVITKFVPGHDHRIQAEAGDANATNVDVSFEFNTEMNCNSVTNGLSFSMSSSGKGGNPTFDANSVKCGPVQNPDPVNLSGGQVSAWSWSVTLNNVPDGILQLTLNNVATQDGTATTGVCFFLWFICMQLIALPQTIDHLLLRKGSSKNVMVFPNTDYDNDAFASSDGGFTFTHKAFGADLFRYSWDYGQNWTTWTSWEDSTQISSSTFDRSGLFWDGHHIMVQCSSWFTYSDYSG